MMKTIAMCLEYPLALRGGVSVVVETLLLNLQDKYQLVLVSPDTPESLAKSSAAKTVARHVPWDTRTVSRETSRKLAEQIAAAGADLAHFHFGGNFGWGNRYIGHCPIPYLDRAGMPVCSTVHGVVHPLDGYCGPQKPWLFKLALFPFAWAGKMNVLSHLQREIAVSSDNLDKLRRWYKPMRGKFSQIYHSRLIANAFPQQAKPREKVILNVGHIAWRKGQLVLCEAFARVAAKFPEWKLVLAGDALEKDIVEKISAISRANGFQDRVLLPGPGGDTMARASTAAIYAQPSLQEALGLALQEAMFAGCACIGSNIGGIPELIEHQRTGLLVRPGNAVELAAALESLMSNPSLRETLGKRGAEAIVQKGMTMERMIADYAEVYESSFRAY